MNETRQRFWEIDVLRGVAIILMVVYHLIFDLTFFGVYPVDIWSLPLRLFRYPVGTLFLLLVGVSLTISYARSYENLTRQQLHRKFILRGLFIFAGGMVVTAATWLYLRDGYIVFGVLHCIGLSIILAYPLIELRMSSLFLGIVCIVSGVYLQVMVTVGFPWLLWLGFIPQNFYTVDYYPLFPWFGVILVGIFLGHTFYTGTTRKFSLPDLSMKKTVRGVGFLGRHSLLIYFIHQPILLVLLALLTGVRIF